MHTTCSDSVGPAQDHATIDLEELLGDGEAQLVYEGLYRLREAKVEALGIVRAAGLVSLNQTSAVESERR
ncbi:MAG: hypothetical protein JSR28_06025 [Proteobacteria bacterium]|nr:hypothetical protein [Pseudomonadota bacterium]